MKMKKIVLGFTVALLFAACNNAPKAESNQAAVPSENVAPPINSAVAPVMAFEKDTYDFGVITSGEKVAYEFKFKNTGKSPLIISNAEATCGCTVPDYPREPVAPGAEGVIKVVFDSSGKIGMQNKVVTLTSNAVPAVTELHVIGDIKQAK